MITSEINNQTNVNSEILANNILIAKFMNDWKAKTFLPTPTKLIYHSDWNWLNSVVEKIESLENFKYKCRHNIVRTFEKIYLSVETSDISSKKYTVRIKGLNELGITQIVNQYNDNKMLAVYNAIIEFITNYIQE
jgi:hypothetical protein